MTDETKNLFDAPWYMFSSPDDEITVIENESGRVLAELDDVKTANRLARLPELYEAMENVLFTGYCLDCRIFDKLKRCDFDTGCPKKNKRCPGDKAWKLLQKVRGGE